MAGTSRIDELRKKFDENPRRYFAPLANEYRKIGDFEQAIFICQEFLPQQPGHMSGHIVYGQALFESGKHDEARSVFETALALDPENLIALRHLGDIARALGDSETARAWYRRVLESDPRNDEISGILTALDADGSAPASMAGTAPSVAPPSDSASAAPLFVESAISAATNVEAPAAGGDPIVTDPLTTAPSEGNFDDIAKLFTSASERAPASEPVAEPASDSSSEPLNLIHEGEDLLGSPDEHSKVPSPSLFGGGGAPAGTSPPVAETNTPQTEPKPFDLPFLAGLTSAEQGPPPAVERPAETLARGSASDASGAFVTETMAELYVKQGHLDQARDVYRQLVQLHPNDSAIAARLRELEGQANAPVRKEAPSPVPEVVAEAGPTIREFLGSIAVFRRRTADGAVPSSNGNTPATDAAAPNDPAPPGNRQSVAGSLNTLFAEAEHRTSPAGPPADLGFGEPPLPGRPSTPAATELSLDHVFRHATPASGTGAHSSFSFDQFFSQQAHKDVAASDADASTEESAGLSDDIQQFNAWLEGLKKS